jgi:hypothetical protein
MSKRIEYGPHAVAQMVERGFTEAAVRWLLDHGKPCDAFTRPGAERRYAKCGKVGAAEAKVVYLESDARIEVITVMWVYQR